MTFPDFFLFISAGVKFILALTDTTPFRSIGARLTGRVLPDCLQTPYTDGYWEEVIRTLTHYTYHPAGTCKMGRPDDPTAVVDPKLRSAYTKITILNSPVI